ncbi:mas-related G-protein coupled receptor member A5-like [Onychostoma macrolepis]|uniref:mas-related G-protein coupled receptor member A5-like n=1 Tax=Onychostoma macrolepis TaxID=369639 RepID=UPI00272B7E95|nr:mas-related G-protein coupled receptor member A5-like [Onychostoma macrolepis]XP_058627775.1 mas-related G-protein coupled receptor member A5-like [Onychostoma macrolepis]
MAQHNISINDSTASDDDLLMEFISKYYYAERVFIWILSVVEIPVMILTLIGLCFIIKSRPAASVFVSNLILSDLIQVICILIAAANSLPYNLSRAYLYSLITGLYFMACVAFERYLLVSHPIWYRSHQSLKLSCFISVIVWFVPLIFVLLSYFYLSIIPVCIVCLIPYPIIILCFAGTRRGLSRSISLTALKRKLILGSLFLVLLTYTFLILPFVIMLFIVYFDRYYSVVVMKFHSYTHLLVCVNPLADCVLYLFMRPDIRNMMKSVRCCCRRQRSNHNQDEHSVVNPQNSCCTVVCCISAQEPASHSLNTCSSV